MNRRTSASRARRATAYLAPTLLASLSGCASTPPRADSAEGAAPSAVTSAAPAAPLPAARELPLAPGLRVGRVDEKNLWLVGGERWLVDAKGGVERPRAPSGADLGAAPRLEGMIALGSGTPSHAGWDRRHVYTFDDALAAPKLLAEAAFDVRVVRAMPGALAIFGDVAAAVIDARTGAPRTSALPPFQMRDVVFADDLRGLADTGAGGLGVTDDGGKTWRPLRFELDAPRSGRVHAEGASLFLRAPDTGELARVDPATGDVGRWNGKDPGLLGGTTFIERWIARRGHPIAGAVRAGIDAGNGTGVIAENGIAARVDLATGAVLETTTFEGAEGECLGVTAGASPYLFCARSALFAVKTGGKLEVSRVKGVSLRPADAATAIGKPGGGLLVTTACDGSGDGVCVKQPDGAFATIGAEQIASLYAATPLADGRVIGTAVRKDGASRVLELIAISAKERTVLAQRSFDAGVEVAAGFTEEGSDGAIHFLTVERAGDAATVALYRHEPGRAALERTALPHLRGILFRNGLLAGKSEGGALLVSRDFGQTFQELPMPGGPEEELVAATPLGVLTMRFVRAGWGPLAEAGAASQPPPATRLEAPRPTAGTATIDLSCKASGTRKGGPTIPLEKWHTGQTFGDTRPATGRFISRNVRFEGPTGASVELLGEGDGRNNGHRPDKWIFHWLDPREVDAKVRTSTGKPAFPYVYPEVKAAWARDGKLFAVVADGGDARLVRATGSGFDVVDVKALLEPQPGAAQAFSEDGSVIAYLAGETLVAWKIGQPPQAIGKIGRSNALLGAPGKAGVPVIVDDAGTTYLRVFPLSNGAAGSPGAPARASASWDGWTRIGASPFTKAEAVPLCGAKPAGSLFRSDAHGLPLSGRLSLDGGAPVPFTSARYDLVADGDGMCVASLTAMIDAAKDGSRRPALLRLSVATKKADLTRVGQGDDAPIQPLSCEAAAR